MLETGGAFELRDDRIERAIAAMRGAEIANTGVGLYGELFMQSSGEPRLADAWLARQQHDLAVAGLGARPAPQQQVYLLVAADQRGQRRSTQRLEPALDGARAQRLPSRHRLRDALEFDLAEISVFE